MTDRPREGTIPPRAVTFDLWYTLVGLRPAEEEAYVDDLLATAAELLRAWPAARSGAPVPSTEHAREVFREEFLRGAALSRRGRSYGATDQIRAAARRLGR